MAITISKKAEILERLNAEGRVRTMDSVEAIANREEINNQIVKVIKDYQHKANISQIKASEFIFTA
jgi:hypothetical protein